ncbi:MAG: hypothetical protein INR62_10020 [Rhodospirillales bacterium]|nr:hypothetical protein [Acetobacter sp.]
MNDVDFWWKTHFFAPFSCLKAQVGLVYKESVPPESFGMGREFARHLWTCCDEEDVILLVGDDPEGASQFVFLVSIRSLERLVLCRAKQKPDSAVIAHKPFAILASTALQWMDEIEIQSPGKTTRRS